MSVTQLRARRDELVLFGLAETTTRAMADLRPTTESARLLRLATRTSVATAGALIIAKLAAWLLTGSVSVLASLVDSLMDAAASLVNLFAVQYALEPADEDALRFEPRDESPDPEALATRRELQALVWKCLQELKPRYREVLVLRDYQDLSYADIATTLKIPRGTVMSRLHRARRLLQEEVRKHRSVTGEATDG